MRGEARLRSEPLWVDACLDPWRALSSPTQTHTGNFSKFLIKDGQPIKRYGPQDAPTSFAKDIEAALPK